MSQPNNCKEMYDNVLRFFNMPKLKPELLLTNIGDIEISGCDFFVDLYKYFSNLDRKPETRIFRIYADVVKLSNTLEIPLLNDSGAILIVARRIEIEPKCKIIVNYKKFFRIVIYAIEMTSKLEIIANNSSYKFEIKDQKNVGKLLNIYNDKTPEYKDIHTFDNIILKNNSFFKMLQYSLNIAIALFYDNPGITRSILSWIVRITRKSELEEIKELYYYALTILTKLNTIDKRKENNIKFVPPFDKRIYKERIDEYMKFAKDYEEKFAQVLNDDEQKVETLYASLMNSSDKAKMYEYLNEQRKTRYNSACELMKKIEIELQKTRKYLSLSVAKIVVQPGGIVSFVETIKKVTNLVQEALTSIDIEKIEELYKITTDTDVKENFDKLKDLDNQVNKIQEIDKKLKSDIDNANKLDSNAKEEHGIIEDLDINSLAERLEVNDQKGILLSTEWELTRRRTMKLLEFPIKQNIEGAEEYLISLENFFIFIDAYIKAKIEEIESSEEFLRTSLQAKLSKGKKERVELMIKKHESKNYDEIKFQLIEHLINIKFWMMIYMEDYLCAYEYWSLTKSEIKPSVIKTFQKLEEDMNKIRDELESAYEQFGCSPTLNWSLIKFDEEKYIEEFKNNRSVIIEVPLNCKELSSYSHINLRSLRVYLEGVGSENETISLYISNTGTLANRDKKNQEHQFRSEAIPTNEFKYRVNSSLNSSAEFDKIEKYIDHDNKYNNDEKIYFVPTPFCQWKINLHTKNDLSGLKSINIHLVTYCHLIV
ncbi:36418_t:CDS:2 [Gigaspora margarita]|uniref:36418_t:CDS:1 n=1 Tax=Gigaspora margarita TaxID=4874 RepID=A0ABN7UPY4_GIGMA|nr:36418_t:CDS:2 [Gigaspora margarita]